ncbi:MAG: PhoH family protein [Acutalibacteraceae bacterium]
MRPRSVGQQFLQEALLLPAEEAPLVIVQGPAGTAKTFYSLAAGLEQVLEQSPPAYRKILICRPNAQFDQDIGFLPGTNKKKSPPAASGDGQSGKPVRRGRRGTGAAGPDQLSL